VLPARHDEGIDVSQLQPHHIALPTAKECQEGSDVSNLLSARHRRIPPMLGEIRLEVPEQRTRR
jgi:hypothetical protein